MASHKFFLGSYDSLPIEKTLTLHNVIIQLNQFKIKIKITTSTANKHYSSAGHHEQKNKKNHQSNYTFGGHNKTTNKTSLNILCVNEFNAFSSSVAVAQFHPQYFLSSQITHSHILLHLLTRSPRTTSICFLCRNC